MIFCMEEEIITEMAEKRWQVSCARGWQFDGPLQLARGHISSIRNMKGGSRQSVHQLGRLLIGVCHRHLMRRHRPLYYTLLGLWRCACLSALRSQGWTHTHTRTHSLTERERERETLKPRRHMQGTPPSPMVRRRKT